jgi:hypothetical protein
LSLRSWYWVWRGRIGRFEGGGIAEIFINGSKAVTAAENQCQDAAIIASLALQHGCPLPQLRSRRQ